ncbi:corticotropin-releasing factor receptor 2-like isoform X2 [Branchiostoma lanceolatum]|uniref:corticotropin-releasing factor receptor 2-like isoform X2 n=1 Tax=Branchiostoma lanceolatum TaxID=7740 RepID=UPI003453C52E
MSLRWYIAGSLCCILQMTSLVGTNSTQSRSPLTLPDGMDMRQLLILGCHAENQQTYARLNGTLICNATWDTVTCWPPAPAGTLVHMPCPGKLRGIKYDTSKNATKMCYENGTWAKKANYNGNCRPLRDSHSAESEEMRQWHRHLENAKLLNNIGHAVSLFCLVIAFVLFGYLKSIRCTRNNIHWNLVSTFILRNICWFIMQEVVNVQTVQDNSWHCRVAVTLFNYFQVTGFFWMFVEGLYLHIMVAHVFGTERIKCWMYAVIGWCVPIPIILAWVIVMSLLQDERCWVDSTTGQNSHYDFIYHGPVIIVLLVNFVILGKIVRILVLKLRAHPNSLDTTHYSIKAVKATVVLLPLLGITYMLFFIHPSGRGTSKIFFRYFNSFLQSFQGCFVSVIYCFSNTEVQNAVQRRVDRWRNQQQCAHNSTPSKQMVLAVFSASTIDKNENTKAASTCNVTDFKSNLTLTDFKRPVIEEA